MVQCEKSLFSKAINDILLSYLPTQIFICPLAQGYRLQAKNLLLLLTYPFLQQITVLLIRISLTAPTRDRSPLNSTNTFTTLVWQRMSSEQLTHICKSLFLAHFFPRSTGTVFVRQIREKFIVTATVDGVLTRREYPSNPQDLADLYSNTSTRVYRDNITYSTCRHCRAIGFTDYQCTTPECADRDRYFTRRV